MLFNVNVHTSNLSSSINLIIAKNEFKKQLAKLNSFWPLTV